MGDENASMYMNISLVLQEDHIGIWVLCEPDFGMLAGEVVVEVHKEEE